MMRIMVVIATALLALCSVGLQAADIAVYAGSEKAATELSTILSHGHKNGRVIKAASVTEAVKADVVVLLLDRKDKVTPEDLNSLRDRKVIGIGYGAAQAFDDLGLEINGMNCAHNGSDTAPKMVITQNNTLKGRAAGSVLTAFQSERNGAFDDYDFAIFAPEKSQMSRVIDVIGRWKDDMNYAPVARQGNFVLVGFAAPPASWTPEYRTFFRGLTQALEARKPEPLPQAKWELTPPGTYQFSFAKSRAADQLFSTNLYFHITKPTTFTARMQQKGSKSFTMMFRSQKRTRLWDRQDTQGERPLSVTKEITQADIDAGGDYWSLDLSNFDTEHESECTVTISY